MTENSEVRITAGTIVLVGCGQMGGAMLRGWLARGAAREFAVIEPAGMPPDLADKRGVACHSTPEALPSDLRPDAVVFAVKPQILDSVLSGYRRWAGTHTLFLS